MKKMNFNKKINYTFYLIIYLFSTVCYSSIEPPELTLYDIAKSSLPVIEVGDELIIYDEQIFFSATDKGLGVELWSLNISTGDVSIKQDINLGVDSSYPGQFIVYQDKLYFNAYTPEYGIELWVFDKKTNSASLVADLSPGQNEKGKKFNSDPKQLVLFNNALYFLKVGENEDMRELWYFDEQTKSFTQQGDVALNISAIFGGVRRLKLVVFDQKLYLIEYGQFSNSDEIIFYDINQETGDLTEIIPSASENKLKNNHVIFDNKIYSTNYYNLSSYDIQTEAVVIYDTSFNGEKISPYDLILDNENAILSANSQIGIELFSFNLNTLETTLLEDIVQPDEEYPYSKSSYPNSFVKYNQQIFFLANNINSSDNQTIWKLDNQTSNVTKILPESTPSPLSSKPNFKIIVDNKLYFTAKDINQNDQIYYYDPESEDISVVSSFENTSIIHELTAIDGYLFFILSIDENSQSLWSFNTSTRGFSKIHSNPSQHISYLISSLTPLNNELYFLAIEYEQKPEIWSYKTEVGSATQHTLFSQTNAYIDQVTVYRNALYFTVEDEIAPKQLWFLYSITKHYAPVTTPQNKTFDNIDDLIVWDNKLYFTHNNDQHLSYYDNISNRYSETNIDMPIAMGTHGEYYSNVRLELAFEDNLYFVDEHRFALGNEPYYLSLTSSTPSLIADLSPGNCCSDDTSWEGHALGSYPNNFYAYDNTLYFNTRVLSSSWPAYNIDLNQSTLWSMEITDDNSISPVPIEASTIYDYFKDISDQIIFNGALFATADVIQNGVALGYELIKLDINSTSIIVPKNSAPLLELIDPILEVQQGSTHKFNINVSDIDQDYISVEWVQVSGPVITINKNDDENVSIQFPQIDNDATVEIQVIASDGNLSSSISFFVEVKSQIESNKKSGGSFNFYFILFLIFYIFVSKKLISFLALFNILATKFTS